MRADFISIVVAYGVAIRGSCVIAFELKSARLTPQLLPTYRTASSASTGVTWRRVLLRRSQSFASPLRCKGESEDGEEHPFSTQAPSGGIRDIGEGQDKRIAEADDRTRRRAAARAAVAVVQEIEDKRKESAGRGRTRPAKTTKDAMVDSCLRSGIKETNAKRAVQLYMFALASCILTSGDQQNELCSRVMLRMKDKFPFEAGTDGPSSEDMGDDEERNLFDTTEDSLRGPASIYDDEVFDGTGLGLLDAAKEVDAVLLSRPNSTTFSALILGEFDKWKGDVLKGSPVKREISGNVYHVITAFESAISLADEIFVIDSEKTSSIQQQKILDLTTEGLYAELGEPPGDLALKLDDVNAFKDEILAGLFTVKDEAQAVTGFKVVRVESQNPSMSPAALMSEVRTRLARTGIDKQVRAFMIHDPLAVPEQIDLLKEKIESGGGSEQDVFPLLKGLFSDNGAFGFILIPAKARPKEYPVLGKAGSIWISGLGVLSAWLFASDSFGLSQSEIWNGVLAGHPEEILKILSLLATLFSLSAVRDVARLIMGWRKGISFSTPRILPATETGILATDLAIKSYPRDGKALFDVVMAGPVAGVLSSTAALILGLKLTAMAGAQALADYPSMPSEVLRGSGLVGTMVDLFLHTNLGVADVGAGRTTMHPLAVAGVASMLWNAASILPLPGSDGRTALSTMDRRWPLAFWGNLAAIVFVVLRIFGPDSGFLLSVGLVTIIAYRDVQPTLQQDNVTGVKEDLGRVFLYLALTIIAVAVLGPMNVIDFLSSGASSLDRGAGAESIAAGLGVGGLGFDGLL